MSLSAPHSAGLAPGFFERLSDAWRAWRSRERLRSELDELSDRGELDRALADCGINRAQLATLIAAHPEAACLMRRMMQRVGVTSEAAEKSGTGTLRDIGWTCSACTEKRLCTEWLDSGIGGDAWRAFCPNAPVFESLREAPR